MKKTIITYSAFSIIIVALLVTCVVLSNKSFSSKGLPRYELNEDDVQEYDLSKFTEYEVLRGEWFNYEEYQATILFDDEKKYSTYELVGGELSLGQIVKKGDSLGFAETGEDEIFAMQDGRVVDLIAIDGDKTKATIFNANSFYIVIKVPQNSFSLINNDSIMKGVLDNGKVIDLKVKKIIYEVVDGCVVVEALPVNPSFDVFPGTNIVVRNNYKKSECNCFINYDAFLQEGKYDYSENTYYEFIVKRFNEELSKYDYKKTFIKAGEKIGNYVGLYYDEEEYTLLVKR